MERRGHERSRVVGIGRIDTGSSYLISCIIRDLTVSGARLMVNDADALPERFQLVFQATGHTTWARVVWRGEGVCGVEFAPSP
jgi:PilZ domain